MGGLAEYEQAIAARIAQAHELSNRMREVRGTGEAADGLIRAEVTAAGRLVGLRLDPRAMRLDSQTLAEEILAAADRAGADATRQVGALTDPAATVSWEDLLAGRAPDPSVPLPTMPDRATFEQMIRDAVAARGEEPV
jgi:DNA-binding protein YbaB